MFPGMHKNSCISLFLSKALVLSLSVVWGTGAIAQGIQTAAPTAGNPAAPSTKPSALPKQPWQERRAKYFEILKAANQKDPVAAKEFDAILTQFESQPFVRTPLENMDILGSFYVPKDEIEKTLIVVSANATVGWYDALRFGSESGRDEIAQREKLFLRAYLIGGAATKDKFLQFMKEHPEQAKKSVEAGIAIAERHRNTAAYDLHWPTAYGLERIICREGGSCEPPKALPADQWDNAWEDAKKKVTAYYSPAAEKK